MLFVTLTHDGRKTMQREPKRFPSNGFREDVFVISGRHHADGKKEHEGEQHECGVEVLAVGVNPRSGGLMRRRGREGEGQLAGRLSALNGGGRQLVWRSRRQRARGEMKDVTGDKERATVR